MNDENLRKTAAPTPDSGRLRFLISLAILAIVSLAFAVLFFQVISPFALPLFLAVVFAVMASPVHERLSPRLGGRGWLSALILTVALLLLLLLPTTICFLAAYRRASDALTLMEQAARGPGFLDGLLDRAARLVQLEPSEIRCRPSKASARASNSSFGGLSRWSATPSHLWWTFACS